MNFNFIDFNFLLIELKALVGLHQQSMLDDEDPLSIDEALIIQVNSKIFL